MTQDDSGNAVGLKEGYFDNLDAYAANEKIVLKQLVASNAKFATTNEEMVAFVKN